MDHAPAVDELDFTVEDDDLGAARVALLEDAVLEFRKRGGHLAPGGLQGTPDAEVAAELNQDRASLVLPELVRLELAHLETDEQADREQILERWRFYWLKFPLDLWARPGWGYNQLQFRAAFNADDAETERPRVHDALPSQEYATLAKGKFGVSVGVAADFKFAAKLPPVPLQAAGIPAEVEAALSTIAKAESGFTFTPRPYEVRVPTVVRSKPDLDNVAWRLEGSRLVQEDDLGLRVVLKVPRETSALTISAMMSARRYFNSFDLSFRERLAELPDAVVRFFKRGAPKSDRRAWDLTSQL